jgi:TetR/AcrR family transcriptional regulator, transcriptional repressor for nem operon
VGSAKGKSRQASKQETREALIRAGMSLFSEKGVDVPSLDAICARAGFTRGAFYVHFRNRDDFLAAVIDRALVAFVDSVVATGNSGYDLGDTVERFVSAAARGRVPLLSQQRLILHLMTRGVQRADKMRARFKALLEDALARIAAAAEDGRSADIVKVEVDPDLIAVWLAASALGLTTLINLGVEVDFDRMLQSARVLLRMDTR